MSNYLQLIICFILGIITCEAQNENLSSFLPEGHVPFKKYNGEVNKDGKEDCIIITKKTNANNIVMNNYDEKVDRNRRGIVVLFKNEEGYELAAKNYNCFSSVNEDGDVYYPPELDIEVERGNIIVHYTHGRYGFWKYTFRYHKNDFELIGYDQSDNRGPVTERITSINFLSKKKQLKVNTNNNATTDGEEIFKETWEKIEIKKLLNLSEIKDFDQLDMSIY